MNKIKGLKKLVLTLLGSIALTCCCRAQVPSKYYAKLSHDDLQQYDSIKALTRTGNYAVYSVLKKNELKSKFRFSYLVLEIKHKETRLFYKLDFRTELKNDSVLRFSGMMMLSGDEPKKDGLWFHADYYDTGKESGLAFKYEPLPANSKQLAMQAKAKGIYRFEKSKLIKLTNHQSEEAFNEIHQDGLYYLPPPGSFYFDAKLDKIVDSKSYE